MLSSSSASTSSPNPSCPPNSLFTLTPPSAAGVALAPFAFVLAFFLAGSGTASSCSCSASSSPAFSFSTSRLELTAWFCFHPLFREAGVAEAVPATVTFLFGVLGCGVVLLLVWRVEERAPYLRGRE